MPETRRRAEACSYATYKTRDRRRPTSNIRPGWGYTPRLHNTRTSLWPQRRASMNGLSLLYKCLLKRSPGVHKTHPTLLPSSDLQTRNKAETLRNSISPGSKPGPGPRLFGRRHFCLQSCCSQLSEGVLDIARAFLETLGDSEGQDRRLEDL